MKSLAFFVAIPLAWSGCASSPSDVDDPIDDGKADGSSTSTFFNCQGLGTSDTTWLQISRLQHSIKLTIEDVGINYGHLASSTSTKRTYASWTTNVFFATGDTLVIPDTLMTTGTGTIVWNQAGITTHWEGHCTKQKPTGDQCLPLIQQIYPVDSSATPTYTTVDSLGHYTLSIPDTTVGAFVYAIDMTKSGILCTSGAVTPTSCSAIVADAIGAQAASDGSSSGDPYVSARAKATTGYTWSGGVHDVESGDFAYTVTTASSADGCKVTSIKPAP